MTKSTTIISWVLRLIVLFVMLMTVPSKFSSSPNSVALFSELGLEPFGRYFVGALELVAGGLILFSVTQVYGAGLAVCLMSGALLSHVVKLGFTGDKLTLAVFASVAFLASIIVLYVNRKQPPMTARLFLRQEQNHMRPSL